MTTAADLLLALRARMPSKLILDRRTGLPYGWGIWMGNRKHAAAPFNDDQVTGVLLARARPSQRNVVSAAMLSPFQAFRSLWWQHWDPRPKDQRRQHWLALLGSFLIHLGFVALLIWVVTVRWAPDDAKPGDESRVRMTFIGDGAVEQGGVRGNLGLRSRQRRLQRLLQRKQLQRWRQANHLYRRRRRSQLPIQSKAQVRHRCKTMRRSRRKRSANR